jgi:hypothetical protein
MKLPVWKAMVLVFFIGFIFMAVVEELFINKIFSVMNGMVTRFEQTEKEEKKDWDGYEKSYEAFNKKSHDNFEKSWKKSEEESKQRTIKEYCNEISKIESQNKLLSEMKSKKYKKPKELIIRAWEKEMFAELEKEAPMREIRLKSAKEMLNKFGSSEKNCNEIS